MKNHHISTGLAFAGIALGLSLPAIAQEPPSKPSGVAMQKSTTANPLNGVTELIAAVHPVSGSNVKGTVTFKKVSGGVEITVSIGGLEPGSSHGFHVHEFGNVTSDDGKSAGGHYNPQGHEHGMPDATMHHAGDFGNLTADDSGNANKTFTVDDITLAGKMNPIIGRAVVVHAKKDDGGQPTGNAGDRIGVGVIGIAKVAEAKPMKTDAPAGGDKMEPEKK